MVSMAACYQGSPPDVGLRQRKGIYSKKGAFNCCNSKNTALPLMHVDYSLSTSGLIWPSYRTNATIFYVLKIESCSGNRPAFGC